MLAMTAVMVGCSQEELVVDGLQNATVDLSGRPVLNEVTLGTGFDSRSVIEEGSAIRLDVVDGDQIGACIIDVPAYTNIVNGSKMSWSWAQYLAGEQGEGADKVTWAQDGASASGFYSIQEHISTNYPFTSENGKFYTNAELVEGNYMFYMPYNKDYRIRERLSLVLPQTQDCSDEVMRETTKGGKTVSTSSTALKQFFAGEMEGYEGALSTVGYQFLNKDNTKPEVSMEQAFAYPLITVVNKFNSFVYGASVNVAETAPTASTMVLDSIQLYYAGAEAENPLFYKKSIKNEFIADKMGGETSWWGDRFAANGTAYTAEILDAEIGACEHGNVNTELPKLENIIPVGKKFGYINEKHVTLKLGKELAYGEDYSFHAILPAANYGNGQLKARIYATIDGKPCVIRNAVSKPIYVKDSKGNLTDEIAKYQLNKLQDVDYVFTDETHGNQDLVLVRGEQYPKAEYVIKNNQAKSLKAFCGDMMTITLENSEIEGVVTGATAFELQEVVEDPITPDPADCGIETNEEFINYMTYYIQNGITLTENPELWNVAQSTWTAGEIAFAKNHKVVINAELVEEIYAHQNLNNKDVTSLTLAETQLGIGADVVVTKIDENNYKFSTKDGYSIKVQYADNFEFGTNGKELVAGINKITDTPANGKLVVKAGESNAVVYLSADATYAGATGINTIFLTEDELTVDAACDVQIIATDGEIVITENGSLTNEKNTYANVTITNDKENVIAGTLGTAVTVVANYAEWPATTIAKESQINKIVVAPAVDVELSIEQAQINKLANLKDVTVELGENITTIKSKKNVTLTNVEEMTAVNAIEWTTDNVNGIIVKYPKTSSITVITNGQGVEFEAIQ